MTVLCQDMAKVGGERYLSASANFCFILFWIRMGCWSVHNGVSTVKIHIFLQPICTIETVTWNIDTYRDTACRALGIPL